MGILDGILILELARAAPGELPGMLLSDMGADVIKIDAPGAKGTYGAEDARRVAFTYTNRNKRSLILDLKSPEGRGIFHKLASRADVLVDCFRPGVMKRLGSDYETLKALNPRLIYCAMSGFGQDGPYRDLPAHDINFLSMAGVLALIGQAGGKPAIPLNLVSDYGGASMHAALGIALALFSRERTGLGQFVDISYFDTTVALLAATPNVRQLFSDGIVARRGEGVLSGAYPFYAVYETLDEKHLTIGSTEKHLFENFCEAIGRPDLARFHRKAEHFERAPNAEEVDAREQIAAIIRTRKRDDWQELLVKADVAVGKVVDPVELPEDPQVRHRAMVVDVPHPEFGNVRQFGIPIKFSATPGSIRATAPTSGQHTDQILEDLGFDSGAIHALRKANVIG